jgi:hypothetical protein
VLTLDRKIASKLESRPVIFEAFFFFEEVASPSRKELRLLAVSAAITRVALG